MSVLLGVLVLLEKGTGEKKGVGVGVLSVCELGGFCVWIFFLFLCFVFVWFWFFWLFLLC